MSKLQDKINTFSDKLKEDQKRIISTKSRGKKFYIAFTVVIVTVYLLAFTSKPFAMMLSNNNKTDIVSEDYNQTISIEGEYDLKVTNAQINKASKELRFDLLIKHFYESYNITDSDTSYVDRVSKPKIIKVLFDSESIDEESAEYKIVDNTEQRFHSTVTVNLDDVDFKSCIILFEYKKLAYSDEDKVDEYGNIIKGEKHNSEICKCYIRISRNDFKSVSKWDNVEFVQPTTEAPTESTAVVTSKTRKGVKDAIQE